MAPPKETPEAQSAFTLPAALDYQKLLTKAREYFYQLDPNIIGINISPRRVKKAVRPNECALVVYVMQKKPLSELDPARVVPKEFFGLRTDVYAPLSAEGAHSSSDDMRAISWVRVHDFPVEAEAWPNAALVRDFGDVCVVQVDGTVVKTNPAGGRYVDFVAAYKLFRTLHGDDYDFVTFFADTDSGMPGVFNSYQSPIFNDVQGIGLWAINDRPNWGTSRLQGFHVLRQSVVQEGRPYTMLQEFGHQFAAHARYRDPVTGTTMSDHLQNAYPGHWADHLDDDQSPMDYDNNDWVELPNGNFRRVFLDGAQRTERPYCNLDLYLMGLLRPDRVGEFTMLRDVVSIPGSIDFSATPVRLHIEDFIAQEGLRVPNFAASPKQWRQAFIVLTMDVHKVHDLADKVDSARFRWEQEFLAATKGRGRIDTVLKDRFGGSADFTVVMAVRQGFGTDHNSLRDMEPDVPLVGTSKDYIFSCPNVNESEAAVLMFQSRAVHSTRNIITINDSTIFGGIPVSPNEDAWNGNVLLIGANILRPSGNVLHIESRNMSGGSGEDIDDFILDNVVVMYKTL